MKPMLKVYVKTTAPLASRYTLAESVLGMQNHESFPESCRKKAILIAVQQLNYAMFHSMKYEGLIES